MKDMLNHDVWQEKATPNVHQIGTKTDTGGQVEYTKA